MAMRLSLILSGALVASATASVAFAGTPISTVSVSVSPEVQKKLDKKYGQKEFTYLSADLQRSIERHAGVSPDGDRLEVTITDLRPNHPTFKELGDRPGLSSQSVSIGGAKLEGVRISSDGRRTPVTYERYDHDIRDSYLYGITPWSTAQGAFNGFARKLARD